MPSLRAAKDQAKKTVCTGHIQGLVLAVRMYVDDYDGWNAFAGNGEISVRSHGTKVAGIAGAIGNNGIGISGVGWNCKVMPVAGSSTFESTVVAAFSYVYKMRSLYEESNGEKGAYVVVTNGSFGVDFGKGRSCYIIIRCTA